MATGSDAFLNQLMHKRVRIVTTAQEHPAYTGMLTTVTSDSVWITTGDNHTQCIMRYAMISIEEVGAPPASPPVRPY